MMHCFAAGVRNNALVRTRGDAIFVIFSAFAVVHVGEGGIRGAAANPPAGAFLPSSAGLPSLCFWTSPRSFLPSSSRPSFFPILARAFHTLDPTFLLRPQGALSRSPYTDTKNVCVVQQAPRNFLFCKPYYNTTTMFRLRWGWLLP